jgi:hypothetical protein
MRRPLLSLGKWMLVIAMITAIGGHFVLFQSVAWTSMMISNAKHGNVRDAFQKTFDGQHPCALCQSIQKARESENKQQTPQVTTAKLDLFLQPQALKFAPAFTSWSHNLHDTFAESRAPRPLLEPPRHFITA